MKLKTNKQTVIARRKKEMNINKKIVTTKSPIAITNKHPLVKEHELNMKKIQITFIFWLVLTTLTLSRIII